MMEILLIKKFRRTFSVIVIMGIVCLGLIIAIIAAGLLNSSLNSKVAALEKRLIIYEKTLGSDPEQAVVRKKEYKSRLLNKNEQINSLFVKTVSVSSTPLSFKQLLFSSKDRLHSKALKQKMHLPLWLGFEEYKINVPDAENTDLLTKELAMIEEVITGAIDTGLNSIASIKLSHQSLNMSVSEQTFKYLPVSLSIKSGSGQLKAFLMNISKMRGVFAVKRLKVKSVEKNKNLLSADITLKFIEI